MPIAAYYYPPPFDFQRLNRAVAPATHQSARPCYHLHMIHPLAEPEYYVGWGTLSLINAGLAQTKNRSGLLWFLISLLLGPIATFLVVVLDPATPAR